MDNELITNFYSFNCRGIRNKNKRLNIFQWLKQFSAGIIFLQETHSIPSDEITWEKEFNGSIYFSHGESNSKGVAILIPTNQNFQYINAFKDNNGRIFLLHCLVDEQELILINIYAPTKDHYQDQIKFLDQLLLILEEYGDKEILLGGDFNTCLNPELDKLGGNIESTTTYTENLLSVISDYSLTDIWRLRNPNKRQYSRRERSRKDIVHSRIDFWLVSISLEYNIKKAIIKPGNSSDHSIIIISCAFLKSNKRGKGTWKFPNNLLFDNNYTSLIKNIISQNKDTSFQEINTKWEFIKCLIRTETISYCKRKAKADKEREMILLNNIEKYENNTTDTENNDLNYEMYLTEKQEWENIQKVKTNGAILRSKAKWIEDGEKNSKYFLGLEKRNYNSKHIKSLIVENNREITDASKILQEQSNFYGSLYSSKIQPGSTNDAFWNNLDLSGLPKLDQNEIEICDSDLTTEEIGKALKDLKNDKSPGSDGFTTNFYKFFWPDIKFIILENYQDSLQKGTLSQNQRLAILNLIPKKDKDLRYLKNWRPISLLNTDYKILTKVLAKRLQKVIPRIISHDQVGYISGRYIGENIRIISDLIDLSLLSDMQGIITLIDFEKAFDSIEWPFLFETLKAFNFGDTYIKWIKAIYNDIKACTCNNGYLSNVFSLTRSIRQGCPISALLFILVVEILAYNIRLDDTVKGINIDGVEIKIRQLADDTSLFLHDLISLKNSLSIFDKFEKAAGLKLNIEKTEVIPLGNTRNTPLILEGELKKIKINLHCFKTLGLWFSHDKNNVIQLNLDNRIKTIENLTYIWASRQLSWKGKITIIKSLLIPQIQHLLSVLYIPINILKRIDQILFKFLWSNKPARIKKETIISSIEEGGLKMPDIYQIHTSTKISMIKRLLSSDNNNWIIPEWKLLNIKKEQLFKKLDIKSKKLSLTDYHHQLLLSWYSVKNIEPQTINEILNEYLCDNVYIPLGESVKTKLRYNTKVIHLYDKDNKFYDNITLNNKLNIELTFLEYYSLKNCIPVSWKHKISSVTNNVFEEYTENTIKIGHKYKVLQKIKQSDIYWELINRSPTVPTSLSKWIEAYPFLENADWPALRTLPFKIMREPYLQTFQYKILHRTINCGYNLHKWKIKDSPNCIYCSKIDTIEHHFFLCPYCQAFWERITLWLYQITDIKYNLTVCEVLLGIPQERDPFFFSLNSIIYYAKYHINRSRNENTNISFLNFLTSYRYRLLAIEKIHQRDGTYEQFQKNYGLIMDNL